MKLTAHRLGTSGNDAQNFEKAAMVKTSIQIQAEEL
jgi:hypothetical protein